MARSNYDLEFRNAVRGRMLTAARRFLAGESHLIEAARSLGQFHENLDIEPELRTAVALFFAIDSETHALPIGAVRAHWAPEALAREDRKIAEIESQWRTGATDAAKQLVDLLDRLP
jgi:hypothetical protein